MVATSTSITPDNKIDKKPVLTEGMLMLKAAEDKEGQIIAVSEKNSRSNLLALKSSTLPTTFLEESLISCCSCCWQEIYRKWSLAS
ncbi:MAG: hypothetical protein WCC17_17025 [Candidatus Nitrosopolaris sp.]